MNEHAKNLVKSFSLSGIGNFTHDTVGVVDTLILDGRVDMLDDELLVKSLEFASFLIGTLGQWNIAGRLGGFLLGRELRRVGHARGPRSRRLAGQNTSYSLADYRCPQRFHACQRDRPDSRTNSPDEPADRCRVPRP